MPHNAVDVSDTGAQLLIVYRILAEASQSCMECVLCVDGRDRRLLGRIRDGHFLVGNLVFALAQQFAGPRGGFGALGRLTKAGC